jgi:hypothetical protein
MMSSLPHDRFEPADDRVEPIQGIRPLPVDVFDAGQDPARHAGRSAVRAAVLAMTPLDGDEPLLPGPLRRPGGAFWGVQSANGLTLALRTAAFATPLSARRDAVEVLADAAKFEIVPVSDGPGGRQSFWVLLRGRVVLVGGQSWLKPGKSTARMLLATLSRLPRS